MSNILEVKDLNVSYGGIKAVKDISFAVPKGEVVEPMVRAKALPFVLSWAW